MISILLLDEDRDCAALLARRLAAADRAFSVRAESPLGIGVAAGDMRPGASPAGGFAAESPAGGPDSVPGPAASSPAGDSGAAPGPAASSPAGGPCAAPGPAAALRADPPYDFVIMSERVAAVLLARAEGLGGARGVVLADAAALCAPTDARGCLYADRYGRVSALAALLRAAHAERSGGCAFPQSLGGSVKYIGCFGLGGACGVSSVAIGIGRDFAAYKGRRALYVSLETLEAEGFGMRRAEGERGIGDFMYLMLRGRDADLRLFFEACLFRDGYGLARFFPSPGLNDLARASPEELGAFFRFLDACGGFDVVVLDLGSECKDAALQAVHLCDALVLVENGSLADAGKRERAAALLCAAWRHDGGEDPIRVTNMLSFSYGADEEEAAMTARDDHGRAQAPADGAERIEIGYDGAGFRRFDGMTDFTLSNEFGIGIRKLTDSLFARICG